MTCEGWQESPLCSHGIGCPETDKGSGNPGKPRRIQVLYPPHLFAVVLLSGRRAGWGRLRHLLQRMRGHQELQGYATFSELHLRDIFAVAHGLKQKLVRVRGLAVLGASDQHHESS